MKPGSAVFTMSAAGGCTARGFRDEGLSCVTRDGPRQIAHRGSPVTGRQAIAALSARRILFAAFGWHTSNEMSPDRTSSDRVWLVRQGICVDRASVVRDSPADEGNTNLQFGQSVSI